MYYRLNERIDLELFREVQKNIDIKIEEYIKIEDLIDIIDELNEEINKQKKEKEEILKDREENFERISIARQVGISDRDFY